MNSSDCSNIIRSIAIWSAHILCCLNSAWLSHSLESPAALSLCNIITLFFSVTFKIITNTEVSFFEKLYKMSFLSIWWYLVFRPDLTNEVILQLSHHSFVCVKGFCRDVTFNNFRDVAWKVDIAFYVVCNWRTFKFEVQMILCRQFNCLICITNDENALPIFAFPPRVFLPCLFLIYSMSGFSSDKSDVIVKIF